MGGSDHLLLGPTTAARAVALGKRFVPVSAVDGVTFDLAPAAGADLSVRAVQIDVAALSFAGLFFGIRATLTIRRDVV